MGEVHPSMHLSMANCRVRSDMPRDLRSGAWRDGRRNTKINDLWFFAANAVVSYKPTFPPRFSVAIIPKHQQLTQYRIAHPVPAREGE